MYEINPMLLIDFYKSVHSDMIPKGMTYSESYGTPRGSRVKRWNEVVMSGMQVFCKKWLIDYFNKHFFEISEEAAAAEFKRVLDYSLAPGIYDVEKVKKLHRLGYLPVEICALPEGTRVPVGIPMFSMHNTHPDFAWLPQALESIMSNEIWYPMITATVGATYREIVNHYYDLTCDDNISRARALGDFDFRGDKCFDAAMAAASGWCLSFLNSATVPVIPYMEDVYNCDVTKDCVAYGAVSTEHFVMCSNYAVDGDEITFLRKLLNELYPNTNFSCVLDSYDYWNVIDNILPQIHDDIMRHNGCMLMRGDSGNTVDVVTKTVFKLWDQFGGSINSKGYKVLDPHVKAIYGDGITVQNCEEIYEILMANGFACSNVALGIGSFSMNCIADEGILKPFTRDTFMFCIKACYAEIDGKEYPIFKAPKEDSTKKSHKGLCYVYRDENNKLRCKDGYTRSDMPEGNLLQPVFCNSKMVKEYTLSEIRETLHGGKFL